ncbi:amino acid ABC transporter substrate-binding protein [Undibacterium sp. Di26W]|uniref:amino acid ABC transporter substrate-binding protein n=1 Tax=Undibacterium sp. Di26W TaxID=3413035 RepID=UPI003BF3472F
MPTLARKTAALLVCALPVMANATDTLSTIRERKTITIAHRESSIPFSYLDGHQQAVGYAIDLCMKVVDAVRRELKLPTLAVKYVPVTPANRLQLIASGDADMECGSTTNTVERKQQVDFSIAYFIASAKMVVRADSGIKNWSDLRDKSVVTTRGTTNARTLADRGQIRSLNLKLLESKDHAEGFGMVEQRVAAAFAMDDVLLSGLKASAKNPADFQVVGDSLSTEPYAIVIRKNDPAFKQVVNRELSRLMLDGEIHAIYEKWFQRPIPPQAINLNMPMGHLLRSSIRFPVDDVADLPH